MKKMVTGKHAHIFLNGTKITYIINEFDDVWSNKYAIKCDRMAKKWHTLRDDIHYPEVSYNRIYRLYEFLWKLGVWKA